MNGNVPVFGLNGKAALSTTYEKAKTARLKLMNFEIDERPLQKMLNQDADGARKFLADDAQRTTEVRAIAAQFVAAAEMN